jgi:phosphohistidine phosphatase SixA
VDLYLVRHAIAFDRDAGRWPDDSLRPLTARGRSRFRLEAQVVRRVLSTPAVVLSSPYVRAWSSAQVLAKVARWPMPVRCEALTGGDIDAILTVIAEHGDASSLALVGHEPYLSMLAEHLLGVAPNEGVVLEFRKGAIARFRLELVDRPEPADGVSVPAQPATLGSAELASPPDAGPPVAAPAVRWQAELLAPLPPATLRRLA